MTGFVTLVGAGCGRADLITLRGKSKLEHCDAVVYDDLIDPALLDFAPPHARRIYMGKRADRPGAKQEDICAALISLAGEGKVVVRLKGGDPFVFGRGGEELLALKQAGIPCEEVPGITSAVAIPAEAGIPVTHRGLSRSFTVITGHTADSPDALPADLPYLAKSSGTLVFLMGLSKLPLIAARLTEYGRPSHTPAAVLSGGNSKHPAAVRGTLADIAEKAKGVRSPAVIVVGDVAALDLSATVPRPLSGLRIGVTGSPRMAERLTVPLEVLGARVDWVCRSRIEALPPSAILQKVTDKQAKWLVFTSPNGVEVFFRHLNTLSVDLRRLAACRFAAIGPVTATALAKHGIYADLCPDAHTSAALADALIRTARPSEEIFLLRSAKGAPVLQDIPAQHGFTVWEIPLYNTVFEAAAPCTEQDCLVFCSADGVRQYLRSCPEIPSETVCVCIGEVTSAALRPHFNGSLLVSEQTDAEGIVQSILDRFGA